jgi:hypothetical protein
VTGPDLLSRAASLLYGEMWQTPLASELGVPPRQVRRWASGDRQIPPSTWPELVRLLKIRLLEVEDVLQELPSSSDRKEGQA